MKDTGVNRARIMPLLIILAAVALLLAAGGGWFYRAQERAAVGKAEEYLLSVARLKSAEISLWRTEQATDAAALAENPFLAGRVAAALDARGDENDRELLAYIRDLASRYSYRDLVLLDAQGRVVLSASGHYREDSGDAAVIDAAVRGGLPLMGEPLARQPSPVVDVVAPIRRGGAARGALMIVLDLSQYLYPLVQSWPGPSPSAETLLVRRDGGEVLFLNNLRHVEGAALKLRIPLSRTDVPAVMAVQGREGAVRGRDYRGVPVVSAVLPVPGSPWFIVAKVDEAEILSEWHFRAVLILVVVAALLLAVLGAAVIALQANARAHYEEQYRAESRLRQEMESHRLTLLSIGDAVITTDSAGRVEMLNPSAQALTGWDPEEARGRPLEDVFRIINEETRQPVPSPVAAVLEKGAMAGLANHTVLVARTGLEVPIADSAAPIKDENGAVRGVVLVFRSQAEERMHRKRTQVRLELIDYAGRGSLEHLVGRALDAIGDLVESPVGFYHFVESDQESLSLWSTRTRSEFCHAQSGGQHYPLDKAGVWADCVRTRAPVIHNDYATLPNRKGMPEGHPVIARELVVPVLREGRVVAILGVGNKPSDYTDRDAETVSFLADETWQIVESVRARDALQAHAHRQQVVAELGQYALAGGDLQRLLDLALERLAASVGVDFAKVLELLPDGSALLLRAGIGWKPGLVGRATVGTGRESQAGYTLSQALPVVVHDLRDEPRFTGPALLSDHGVTSGISVVIGDPGAPYGVLGLHTREPRTFSRDEINFTQAVANLIAEAARRSRLEEQRLESEQRYRLLFEASPDAILLMAVDGTVYSANPAACAMFGVSEDELRTRGFGAFIDTGDPRLGDQLIQQVRSGTARGELRLRRAGGEVFEAEGSSGAITTGGEQRIWIILRDVSGRKALESRLLQAQKMESVGRLAGGVAHDFNNMLQVILSYAEMSLPQVDPQGAVARSLKQIHAAARRSADLTGQLLAFARKQTVSPKVLDLAAAVEGTLKMLQRLIGEDIDLAWKPRGRGGKVRIDPSQLDQVLANLAVNARDAIQGVGKLTVETGEAEFDAAYCAEHPGYVPGRYMMLGVSDTGRGMDKETMGHLFEPFFTTKALGKGTGLGLATLYGIVRQNEGFVNVYSEVGVGTTFRIYFPRVEEGAAEEEQRRQEAVRGGRETILLVEDEEAILELGRGMLGELGYTVLAARTPGQAIETVEEHGGRIDLLITDVVMPEMNGRELAGRLRALKPGMKCLFMSGYTADVIAHQGVLEEGIAFLAKPFSRAELAARVRAALETLAPA